MNYYLKQQRGGSRGILRKVATDVMSRKVLEVQAQSAVAAHRTNHQLNALLAALAISSSLPTNFEPRRGSVAADPTAISVPLTALDVTDRDLVESILPDRTVLTCHSRFIVKGLLVASLSHWPTPALTTQCDVMFTDEAGNAMYGSVVLAFDGDDEELLCLIESATRYQSIGELLPELNNPLLREAQQNGLFNHGEFWALRDAISQRVIVPASSIQAHCMQMCFPDAQGNMLRFCCCCYSHFRRN